MSEPKLQRNSSLQEWQWVYLEQEVAFLSGMGNKKRGEKHLKELENLINKQKYIKN